MKKGFWPKYHKWVGLFFTFFILMFCFSGIVLNHRDVFSKCEVGRWWMPSSYHYDNYNNGIVKGTFALSDSLLAYGNAGIWLTDSCFSDFADFNLGLSEGIDNRKISRIVRTADGTLWAAGLFDVYRFSGGRWQSVAVDCDERIADLEVKGDSLVVLSRSMVYVAVSPYTDFQAVELLKPECYSPKVTLFKTIWLLHSGELFGFAGKIVVDILGVVLVVLCLTGVVYFFFPALVRRLRKKKKDVSGYAKTLSVSARWHNKLGAWLIVLTLFLAVTGMCLRPPLMIPFVLTKCDPVPGSSLDSKNPWHDKLRVIRWDETRSLWLLSSSGGYYSLSDFDHAPMQIDNAPSVSPMGVNVMEQNADSQWLVGSFSGLFVWEPNADEAVDYFTGKPAEKSFGRAIGSVAVSGFSRDVAGEEVVFDYSSGARTLSGVSCLKAMPEVLENQPMSLWNFCLELHVGRCYQPFLGPFSELFVFLSGVVLTLILLSGYIVYRRGKRARN